MLTLKTLFNYSFFLKTGWAGIFAKDQPLNLEIGCGYGQFLVALARLHPEENFIGLDLISKLLAKTQGQIQTQGLENAAVLKADARLSLRELFTDGQLNRIYLNFPDPWPKKRHSNRRILQAGTLPLFECKLKPEGQLHFVSDEAVYARNVSQLLDASPHFESILIPPASPFQTKYERKWRADNRPLYRLCYRKNPSGSPGPAHGPAPTPYTRLLRLSQPNNPLLFFQRFQPWVHQTPDLILIFKQCFINPSATKVLLNMTLAEPGFLSHSFFLEMDAESISIPPTSYIPHLATQDRVWKALGEAVNNPSVGGGA